MEYIKLGDRVKVTGKNVNGKVVFIGETHFSEGLWYGLMLDEPIGRHDGMVEGKRYFKCPRNHGIFLRGSLFEKISHENTDDKANTASPNRNTCLNYSNYVHKLKTEKDLTRLMNRENIRETEIENREKKVAENFHKSPINSNYLKPENKIKSEKIKSARRNVENKHHTGKENTEKITENHKSPKDGEWQIARQENEELKVKLKNTEDILNDTLEKYTKTIEENQHLWQELENKKKRIRIQRDHLKLLKMRQCNHFKEMESPETSCRKPNPSLQEESGDANVITPIEGLAFSDEELNLGATKNFTSTQRVFKLEERIQGMKQGLIRLKEFLKCHRPATFATTWKATNERDTQSASSNTDSSTRENHGHSNFSLDLERAKTMTALIEYYDMLCDMTRSRSHITDEDKNSISVYRNVSGVNHHTDEENDRNNIQKFNQQLSSQNVSDFVSENSAELPRTSKEFETLYKTHSFDEGEIQNFLQGSGKQHTGQPLNISLRIKQTPQRHRVKHRSPLNFAGSANELKQLMPTDKKGKLTSSSALTEQSAVMENVSDSPSNSSMLKPDLNASVSSTSLEESRVSPFKSSGGGDAVIVPRKKTPDRRNTFK